MPAAGPSGRRRAIAHQWAKRAEGRYRAHTPGPRIKPLDDAGQVIDLGGRNAHVLGPSGMVDIGGPHQREIAPLTPRNHEDYPSRRLEVAYSVLPVIAPRQPKILPAH